MSQIRQTARTLVDSSAAHTGVAQHRGRAFVLAPKAVEEAPQLLATGKEDLSTLAGLIALLATGGAHPRVG